MITKTVTNSMNKLVGLPPQQLENELYLRRMDTIQALMRGNLYLIRTALSHITGKSDALSIQLERGKLHLEDETFHKWLDDTRISVDSITTVITEIERSNMLGRNEIEGFVSAQELAELFGATMRGFLRSVHDSRSVTLTLETGQSKGQDFPIQVATLLDQITPLLIKVLNESVMDGKIYLSSDNNETDKLFIISFSADLVGRLPLSELLQSGFGNWAGVENGEVRKIGSGGELIAKYKEEFNLYTIELHIKA